MTETQWMDQDAAANAMFWAGRARAAEAMERNRPAKGKTVEVVRGRKTPIGFTGFVMWEGTDRFGNDRVGIKAPDGTVEFTAASNVRVIQADEADDEVVTVDAPSEEPHDTPCVCGTYDRCKGMRQRDYARSGNVRDLHRAYND